MSTNTPNMRTYIDILSEQPVPGQAMGEDPVQTAQAQLKTAQDGVKTAQANMKAAQPTMPAAPGTPAFR